MKDVNELKDQRTHTLMTMQDIASAIKKENRTVTEEEKTRLAALEAEVDLIDAEIKTIQDSEKTLSHVFERLEDSKRPDTRRTRAAEPSPEPKASTPIIPVSRYGSLKAFKGKDAERNAYEAGMWMVATLCQPGHQLKSKAHEWCRDNGTFQQIRNALSTGVPSAGGALVPDAMAQAIIDLREQYGIVRQWCDVMPMTSDVQVIPRRSGSVTPYWTGEKQAITDSDPSWNNVQLTAKKLGALTKISSELSEDAIINIADWVTMDIGQQFAYEEDRVALTGTGAATDGNIQGIIPILQDGNHGGGFYETSATHELFSEIDVNDIAGIMGRLPQYATEGSAFFCSRVAAETVFGRLMAAAGGNNSEMLKQFGIERLGQRGIVGAWRGYPIVVSQVMPATDSGAALNDKVQLLYGNMRLSTTLGERRVITFATDSSIYFAEDMIAIKATARLDIVNHSLGDNTTAGPMVGLRGSSS